MATSQRRMNESWVRLALHTLLCMLIFHNGAFSQEVTDALEDAGVEMTIITVPPDLEEYLRGDDNPIPDPAPADPVDDATTPEATDSEAAKSPDAVGSPDVIDPTPEGDALEDEDSSLTIDSPVETATAVVLGPKDTGHKVNIRCVDKDMLKDQEGSQLLLRLKDTSSCEESMAKMLTVLPSICDDCDVMIHQEDSSATVIISGDDIAADAKGMADKFSSEHIKERLGVVEAQPRWGKHPPTVLVSLLLTGLLLAAGLIGGYCWRNHRRQQAKSAKLAEESFPVDQENQGNTLVSVAPLHPQEPQEKPSVNGESPEGVKTEAPPTNGHSTTKSPVADTEL